MTKKRKYTVREKLILALGGAIKRNRKGPAPENKMVRVTENKGFGVPANLVGDTSRKVYWNKL